MIAYQSRKRRNSEYYTTKADTHTRNTIYEGRSKINASYFIMLAHQYSVKFRCRATDDSRGAV